MKCRQTFLVRIISEIICNYLNIQILEFTGPYQPLSSRAHPEISSVTLLLYNNWMLKRNNYNNCILCTTWFPSFLSSDRSQFLKFRLWRANFTHSFNDNLTMQVHYGSLFFLCYCYFGYFSFIIHIYFDGYPFHVLLITHQNHKEHPISKFKLS